VGCRVAIWLRCLLLGLRGGSTISGCGGAEEGGLECAHSKYGCRSVGQVNLSSVICSCQSCIREDVGTSRTRPWRVRRAFGIAPLQRPADHGDFWLPNSWDNASADAVKLWACDLTHQQAAVNQRRRRLCRSLMLFVDCQIQPFNCADPLLWGSLLGEGGGFQARRGRCKLSGRSQAKWGHISCKGPGRSMPHLNSLTAESWKLPGTQRTAFTNNHLPRPSQESHWGLCSPENHLTLTQFALLIPNNSWKMMGSTR
jgi:hypothetical protein